MTGLHLGCCHTAFGRQRCPSGRLQRHRHRIGYVAVVLSGHYHEAGDTGRFEVAPGDALVHGPYDAHLNLFERGSAEVLNLPLGLGRWPAVRLAIADPDELVRLAERDLIAAVELVRNAPRVSRSQSDWPDLLAKELRGSRPVSIAQWASRHGLHPGTVSRGFRQAFGTTPKRYQMEARVRRAMSEIVDTPATLTSIAYAQGFSDQAHMCRSIMAISGRRPGELRRASAL